MPWLACAASALSCLVTGTEVTRTAGLRVPNVRYAIGETPMRLFYISSSILRNVPAYTRRISSLQLSQVPGFDSALSSVQDPRRRKEPSHRNSNASKIGAQVPTMMHESSGGAAQVTRLSVPLRSRRDSMNFAGFPKPQPSPKHETSLDQDWLKEMGQSGHPLSGRPKQSTREGIPRSSKFAGLSRNAPLHDYSSKTIKGSKRAMRSSRSMKATANFHSGDQNYKDQREQWQIQKRALSEKFGPSGWSPRKRLSPDTLEGIRALHVQYPDKFTTPVLADHFRVSPEAIRRILKSKWRPKDEEEERRRQRWERRGENIWSQMVEVGIKPPKKWRDMGVGKSRERKPNQSEQLEPQKKSKSKYKEISSLLSHSTTNFRTISANGHENGSPVPLADRIL